MQRHFRARRFAVGAIRVAGTACLVVLGAALAATFTALAGSLAAAAHVTVHPTTLPAGSSDVELTFRVPNERNNANSVALQVFFPSNLPLLTVDVQPVSGWRAAVDTRNLPAPVQTDDGSVSEVVSDVTWTATSGGLAPGQYQDFTVAVGTVPDHAGQLAFKALQTYSSGEIVRWIEVPSAGQPAPDYPAPVVTLTPPAASPTAGSTTVGSTATSSGAGSAQVLAIVAVVLSALSLAGVGWLVLRERRRT